LLIELLIVASTVGIFSVHMLYEHILSGPEICKFYVVYVTCGRVHEWCRHYDLAYDNGSEMYFC